MADLNRHPNLPRPDDIYQQLIDLHSGCSEQESHRRNAKLVLCLANHIGDSEVIRQAIEVAAREGRHD
ncbi:MAG: DUF2783 domain-containing protein [Pseudomonadota bacterium]